MPKYTIAEEFHQSIKHAARDSGLPSQQAAAEYYTSQRKLVDAFTKDWVIEKLAALIRLQRGKDNREQDRQYKLVGFKPPRKFALKDGTEMEWGEATLRSLRQGRSVIWEQHKDYKHPAVQRFDKAIAFMEGAASQQKAITWAEAIEKAGEKPR